MTDLAEKWQSGDESAFEALFQQYQSLVFKTAYLMTGSREEAEDILQEVFVGVWKSRHTFNPAKGRLTTWLYRITVNQCAGRHRKRQPVLLSLEKVEEDGFCLPEVKNSELPEGSLMDNWELRKVNKGNEFAGW